MSELIALSMTPGILYLETIKRIWDEGNAFLPLDTRLSKPATQKILDAMTPRYLIDNEGKKHSLANSLPTSPDEAVVIITSGTTGEPKGVVLSHMAIQSSVRSTHSALGVDIAKDKWLACLPLSHIGGLAVIFRSIFSLIPVEILPQFDPDAVTKAASEGATLTSLVPTALQRIDPSIFRKILLGGSAAFFDLAPNVVMTYGMSETGSGIVYNGIPIPDAKIKISESGEILVKGPMLFKNYRDQSNPKDEHGWFHTGDGGFIDENDKLVVHGRIKEMIITGGENIWPKALEVIIQSLPGIKEAAVIGCPDKYWGQKVVAFIVLDDHSQNFSTKLQDQIKDTVKQNLSPWAVPKRIIPLDKLPRNSGGKVLKQKLELYCQTESL